MPSVDEIIVAKERAEARFLGAPGVTAVDVGYKEVGGQRTGQVAIRVHVTAKTDIIPDDQRVPAEIEGVVTDVLERRYELQVLTEQLTVVSPQADTTHYATLQGGISMGPSRVVNGSIFAGTLGAIVIDNATNQHAALTNFHVACVDNTFHIGDRMVQPSRIDTGVVPTDEFGSLARETLSSDVDGAVISIDSGRSSQCQIVDIGLVRGTMAATLGMAVRKRGRTTGLTYGSVDGLAMSVNIDYGDGIGVRTLRNQVSIAADTTRNPLFSDHGDSGSVIVDDSGVVVGLLFAGAGASTLANPIASVLSELNISMRDQPPLMRRSFQTLDGYQHIFVLGTDGNLWLEHPPFGNPPPARQQVDGSVFTFQALDNETVLTRGTDGNLWLEHGPFGTVPPSRQQVDGSVQAFQGLNAQTVFVQGMDGNLWLENGPFGHVPPPRVQVDGNVEAFAAVDENHVFVLGTDGRLWLEEGPFGHIPPSRQLVATDVRSFLAQAVWAWVWVLDNEGNLWLYTSPFGSNRQQVDGNVLAFQPLDIDHAVVLGTDGKLWLEQGPFGHVPPARQQIDANVLEFAATDENNVLVLGTDRRLWWEQAPWNTVPPRRQLIDGTVV